MAPSAGAARRDGAGGGGSLWAWCSAAARPGAVCGSLPAERGRSWGRGKRASAWPSRGPGEARREGVMGTGTHAAPGRGRPGCQGHRVGAGESGSAEPSQGKGARQGGPTLPSQLGRLRACRGSLGSFRWVGVCMREMWSPGEALRREDQPRLGQWTEGTAVTCLGTRSLPRTTAVTNSLEYSMASSLQGKPRRGSGGEGALVQLSWG